MVPVPLFGIVFFWIPFCCDSTIFLKRVNWWLNDMNRFSICSNLSSTLMLCWKSFFNNLPAVNCHSWSLLSSSWWYLASVLDSLFLLSSLSSSIMMILCWGYLECWQKIRRTSWALRTLKSTDETGSPELQYLFADICKKNNQWVLHTLCHVWGANKVKKLQN